MEKMDTKIIKEILDYCEEKQMFSYYEMMTYACENKPEWVEAMKDRNSRSVVSLCLRDAHRKTHTKYANSFPDAIVKYRNARIEYDSKRNKEVRIEDEKQ